MHILNINFISFNAQICNALHMQGKKGDFGIFGTLNPPMFYKIFAYRLICLQVEQTNNYIEI